MTSVTQDGLAAHLPVVHVTCPAGHRTGTRKASGRMLRCQRCWHDNGIEVMVTVTSRDAPDPVAEVVCKGCGGTAERREDRRGPAGWYGLTVAVPDDIDGRGKGFIWLGQFCSVACLAASVPELRRQEALAHQVYAPVRPRPRQAS